MHFGDRAKSYTRATILELNFAQSLLLKPLVFFKSKPFVNHAAL